MAATYYSQILARWDWPRIVRDMVLAEEALREAWADSPLDKPFDLDQEFDRGVAHAHYSYESEGWIVSAYLGSVLSHYPSGKYYMPWTTNQTPDDVDRDSRFNDALEKAADKFGLYVFRGEGDPTDIYVGREIG